ncbi:MAG: tetratricopeptide repeat protein, partial [SAR324 cluster bacterium]|nr:tetratricopeptide repeat protein [SAR324 cluster bacterium]
ILFLLIYLYLFQYFPLKYLLMDTVITGGDTGSHYKTAAYLKEILLPQGKIIGWYPGNYGGYPLFIMYFPLLYLLAVGMSHAGIALTVSFKIVTILGPLLLPVCTYYMVKLCRFRFPGPGLAAAGSLLFLVNTSNSMWGGNLYSTLAGEFSYAVSFSLTFVFFGVLYRLVDQIKEKQTFSWPMLCWAIALLTMIGLTHGFTLIICSLSALFFLFSPRQFLKKSLLLLVVFGVSGLLFAGWFVQLFVNIPYTTAFNIIWTFSSVWEVIPKIIIPPLILFLIYSCYACIPGRYKWQWLSRQERQVVIFLWFVIVLCVLCYFGSETLKLPDIRFIPFVHFLVTVWGVAFLAIPLSHRFVSKLLPFIGFCGIILWLSYFSTDAHHWTRWNFSGFEKAPNWVFYKQINQFLSGTVRDPRVAYEHNKTTNSMGTVRAFESLPYYSGRSTLEGLYFQSSLLSPFVFYAQSLYSKEISCPFPDYPCSSFDLQRAADFLQLMNSSQIILVSNEAKQAVRMLPERYRLDQRIDFSKYEIWKLNHETGYVKVLSEEPESIPPENFRHKFYHWYRNYQPNSRFLYTLPQAYRWIHGIDQIPPAPSSDSSRNGTMDCRVTETIQNESVSFETNCPGKPHLVKIAYNPGWKAKGAVGPYLISPAFMLVYPTQNQVFLEYDNVGPRILGLTMTGFGILFFLLIFGLTIIPRFQKNPFFDRVGRWLRIPFLNRTGYVLFILVFVVSLEIVGKDVFSPGYHAAFKQAERSYTYKDYQSAQEGFLEIIERWKDEPTIDRVYYFLGLAYYLNNQCEQASHSFEQVLNYRDSEYLAEAYYHLGICARMQSNMEKAREYYRYVIEVLNDPIWANHARDRLREVPNE